MLKIEADSNLDGLTRILKYVSGHIKEIIEELYENNLAFIMQETRFLEPILTTNGLRHI